VCNSTVVRALVEEIPLITEAVMNVPGEKIDTGVALGDGLVTRIMF